MQADTKLKKDNFKELTFCFSRRLRRTRIGDRYETKHIK